MFRIEVHLLIVYSAVDGHAVGALPTDPFFRLLRRSALQAIGVRPETHLAKEAGLDLGSRGGIKVDPSMRTSDPSIWAVGDAVEVKDLVTGEWTLIPLAGPANRQGRIAANAIMGK